MTRLHGLGVSSGTVRGVALALQQPARLRLRRLVTRAGCRRAVPVAVCGEMAGDAAVPVARKAVASLHTVDVRQMARDALALATAAEIADDLDDARRASLMQSGRA